MRETYTKHLNKRPGLCLRLIIYYLKLSKEFLRTTVLNGLKYLTFKHLTLWEKLFFLSCFIAASYNSFNFALGIVEKWQSSPVMISMNPQTSSIMQEPFPALTICTMNQAIYSKIKDFDVESLEYAMMQKLCFQEINYTSFAHKEPRSKNDTFSNFIFKYSQSCSDMVVLCEYGNLKIACSDLFREVLTDEGLCCAFNVVHPYILHKGDYFMPRDYTSIDGPSIPLDWNLEKPYPQELPKSFYPRKPLGSGKANGFTIVLNGDLDNYFCASTNGQGFKLALHNPIHIPIVKETGVYMPIGYQTSFRVTPLREEADISLRKSTKPKERQCYFSDEYPLQYFRYYTQRNCEVECDAQFMLRKCNCLVYHMPVISKNATECHVRHFDCQIEAEKDYVDEERLACKKECLSNCNELGYFSKPFFNPLDNNGFLIKNPYFRNMSQEDLSKYAVLQIFFPKSYYRGNVKIPYTRLTEFLSQVGGIMSLMMGFSIISLVEMVYFFVIKPFLHAWRNIFYKNMVDILEINVTDKSERQQHPNPNNKLHNPTSNVFLRPQLLHKNQNVNHSII